jgi:preprotein translocase subunit SecD
MVNQYSLWKYLLLLLLVVFGLLYALPNLYGDVPAVQISAVNHDQTIDASLEKQVLAELKKAKLNPLSDNIERNSLLVQLGNTDEQARAQELLKTKLGDQYIVALYLMPTTPEWLRAIGANPMRLGLDLRGGVHFLLAVDVDAVFKHQADGDLRNIAADLREERIRYAGLSPFYTDSSQGVHVRFRSQENLTKAFAVAQKKYTDYQWSEQKEGGFVLTGTLGDAQYQTIRQNTMEQSMVILRNRVNELGISEAVVTQQGQDQIAVDLPGIQDATQAQNIIGKTATLEFHLVDVTEDAYSAASSGVVPANDQLEYKDNTPYLLDKEIILQGSNITTASSNYGDQGPEVSIRLSGGSAVTKFNKITAQNVGKPMATLYVETKPVEQTIDGKKMTVYKTEKRVINVASINSALGNSFRVTGIESIQQASELALLLRAGALPVPIHIVEERTIGPSLGQQNINKGLLSVEIGFAIVVLFMLVYYRLFGFMANLALGMNLLLIVSIMSILGAVMTLPGIAGIVLTVGMAVDANVLVFERIREELRAGVTPQAAIYSGYGRAMTTIVDANVTTLIVAIVLFSLGSGPVKGFAVTLTIGLITSMITAIFGTRALANLIYGGKTSKKLSIGIKGKSPITFQEPANS